MKIRNFKHLNLIMVMAFCLFIFGPMSTALAEDPPAEEVVGDIVEGDDSDPEEPAEDPEEPAFQNPTQAQRAINIAEAYAAKPDPELEEAMAGVDTVQNELDKAKSALAEAEVEKDEEAIKALKEKVAQLESELESAEGAVDSRISEYADVTPEDIAQMRADGMGWGEICHKLGLHPSISGMGHTKMYRNNAGWKKGFDPDGEVSDIEIEEATARNFKSGFSKGHGVSADKGNNGKSSEKSVKGKGNSGNKSGNKGNKGGNKGNNGGKKK